MYMRDGDRRHFEIAWRAVRRLHNKLSYEPMLSEPEILDLAQAELGGERLTLDWQCLAGSCWAMRRWETEAHWFQQLKDKRFYKLADLCRDRWDEELRAERRAELMAAVAAMTPETK